MPDTSTPIARLAAAQKAYGEVQALDRLDLELHRGEVLALLGPNGAGKTTAISLLLGLLKPDAGEVTLFGGNPADTAARCRIGAMLQSSGIAPTLKVEEQIDLFRSYYPTPAPIERLVDAADLGELMHRRSNELSGGQLQRVMFALAMAGDPELLFLDEPSAGLDIESRRRLWTAVRELTDGGKTVLLTTHHLEEADALADRVAVIDHGRLIAEGSPAELEARVSGRLIRCTTSVALDTLRSLDGVSNVQMRGAATEILTSRAEDVLRRLLAMDSDIHDLEVRGVGLEQAFLTLTAAGPGDLGSDDNDDNDDSAWEIAS